MITDLNVSMTLTGVSGQQYLFKLYSYDFFADLANCFTQLPALYVFSKRTLEGEQYNHDLIYLGETGDLSKRFSNHHKEKEIGIWQGNCIWIHVFSGTEKQRLDAETDLLDSYDFHCNVQNN